MRRWVLVALLLGQVAAADQPPKELLGRWHSIGNTASGFGEIVTFLADGTVDVSFAVVVEMPYRIEGEALIFPPATKTGQEQRMKVEFPQPDELRLAESVWKRQGPAPDPKHPLLGEWVGTQDVKGKKLEPHYLFSSGRALMTMAVRTSHGKYSIQGTTMRLEVPDSPPMEGKFQLEGDVLTVPGARGAQDHLQRY